MWFYGAQWMTDAPTPFVFIMTYIYVPFNESLHFYFGFRYIHCIFTIWNHIKVSSGSSGSSCLDIEVLLVISASFIMTLSRRYFTALCRLYLHIFGYVMYGRRGLTAVYVYLRFRHVWTSKYHWWCLVFRSADVVISLLTLYNYISSGINDTMLNNWCVRKPTP